MRFKGFIKIFIPLVIIEFSIIISSFWMLGDYDIKRFNQWSISEWMINYQAGFVRRGLLGEILYQLNFTDGVIPALYLLVLGFYSACIAIFIVVYLASRISSATVMILSLLIPGGIFHMAISVYFYTRKEILFLIHFGILCLVYLVIQRTGKELKPLWIGLFGVIAIIGGVLLTLVHEPYLFMAYPITLFLCFILRGESEKNFMETMILIIFSISVPITFLICSLNHGDQIISQKIWDSYQLSDRLILAPNAPYTASFATAGIGWGFMQHLSTLYGVFITGTWIYWLLFWLANGFALVCIASRISFACISSADLCKFKEPESLRRVAFVMSIFFGYLISSSMFFIASDYGRWIACATNLSLFLSFAIHQSAYLLKFISRIHDRVLQICHQLMRIAITAPILVVILIYELTFQMPECCLREAEFLIRYDHFFRLIFS